jgi:hypothetical protein
VRASLKRCGPRCVRRCGPRGAAPRGAGGSRSRVAAVRVVPWSAERERTARESVRVHARKSNAQTHTLLVTQDIHMARLDHIVECSTSQIPS